MTDTPEEAGPAPDSITNPVVDPLEIKRITDLIIDACGSVDIECALTAICNLAGQLVCALAEGNPSAIKMHADSINYHIRKTATQKMIYDDQKHREAIATAEAETHEDA